MKIRIVSNGIFPENLEEGVGGALRLQLEIARVLGKNNQVQLISKSREGSHTQKTEFGELVRIKLREKLKVGKKDFSYLFPLLLFVLKEGKYDILHASTNPYILYLPRARRKVLHLHMSTSNLIKNTSYQKALQKADAIICCSKFIQREILEYTNYPSKKVHVIYNGVNLESLRMPRQKKENGIRILYAGQINKEKGLEHLIEAFKIVSKDFPNVALLIAGSASIWPDLDKRKFEVDKRYELEMKEKAKGGKIKFLGKLSLNELYKVYNRCDVFVLPSVIQEALPMVVLEAMASGLPIIASNVGGVPELVQHEKTGLLVKPGDLGELAEALRKLLSDERLREKMGKESYQYAEEFSIEKMTEQIYTLYEEILSK
jgi:glycosyltransferase involved in cell wall biosynthesis